MTSFFVFAGKQYRAYIVVPAPEAPIDANSHQSNVEVVASLWSCSVKGLGRTSSTCKLLEKRAGTGFIAFPVPPDLQTNGSAGIFFQVHAIAIFSGSPGDRPCSVHLREYSATLFMRQPSTSRSLSCPGRLSQVRRLKPSVDPLSQTSSNVVHYTLLGQYEVPSISFSKQLLSSSIAPELLPRNCSVCTGLNVLLDTSGSSIASEHVRTTSAPVCQSTEADGGDMAGADVGKDVLAVLSTRQAVLRAEVMQSLAHPSCAKLASLRAWQMHGLHSKQGMDLVSKSSDDILIEMTCMAGLCKEHVIEWSSGIASMVDLCKEQVIGWSSGIASMVGLCKEQVIDWSSGIASMVGLCKEQVIDWTSDLARLVKGPDLYRHAVGLIDVHLGSDNHTLAAVIWLLLIASWIVFKGLVMLFDSLHRHAEEHSLLSRDVFSHCEVTLFSYCSYFCSFLELLLWGVLKLPSFAWECIKACVMYSMDLFLYKVIRIGSFLQSPQPQSASGATTTDTSSSCYSVQIATIVFTRQKAKSVEDQWEAHLLLPLSILLWSYAAGCRGSIVTLYMGVFTTSFICFGMQERKWGVRAVLALLLAACALLPDWGPDLITPVTIMHEVLASQAWSGWWALMYVTYWTSPHVYGLYLALWCFAFFVNDPHASAWEFFWSFVPLPGLQHNHLMFAASKLISRAMDPVVSLVVKGIWYLSRNGFAPSNSAVVSRLQVLLAAAVCAWGAWEAWQGVTAGLEAVTCAVPVLRALAVLSAWYPKHGYKSRHLIIAAVSTLWTVTFPPKGSAAWLYNFLLVLLHSEFDSIVPAPLLLCMACSRPSIGYPLVFAWAFISRFYTSAWAWVYYYGARSAYIQHVQQSAAASGAVIVQHAMLYNADWYGNEAVRMQMARRSTILSCSQSIVRGARAASCACCRGILLFGKPLKKALLASAKFVGVLLGGIFMALVFVLFLGFYGVAMCAKYLGIAVYSVCYCVFMLVAQCTLRLVTGVRTLCSIAPAMATWRISSPYPAAADAAVGRGGAAGAGAGDDAPALEDIHRSRDRLMELLDGSCDMSRLVPLCGGGLQQFALAQNGFFFGSGERRASQQPQPQKKKKKKDRDRAFFSFLDKDDAEEEGKSSSTSSTSSSDSSEKHRESSERGDASSRSSSRDQRGRKKDLCSPGNHNNNARGSKQATQSRPTAATAAVRAAVGGSPRRAAAAAATTTAAASRPAAPVSSAAAGRGARRVIGPASPAPPSTPPASGPPSTSAAAAASTIPRVSFPPSPPVLSVSPSTAPTTSPRPAFSPSTPSTASAPLCSRRSYCPPSSFSSLASFLARPSLTASESPAATASTAALPTAATDALPNWLTSKPAGSAVTSSAAATGMPAILSENAGVSDGSRGANSGSVPSSPSCISTRGVGSSSSTTSSSSNNTTTSSSSTSSSGPLMAPAATAPQHLWNLLDQVQAEVQRQQQEQQFTLAASRPTTSAATDLITTDLASATALPPTTAAGAVAPVAVAAAVDDGGAGVGELGTYAGAEPAAGAAGGGGREGLAAASAAVTAAVASGSSGGSCRSSATGVHGRLNAPCLVCGTGRSIVMLLPCHDLVLCRECSEAVKDKGWPCPACNAAVDRHMCVKKI